MSILLSLILLYQAHAFDELEAKTLRDIRRNYSQSLKKKANYNLDDIEKKLLRSKVQTIPEFIEQLPKELRTNFVLMEQSRSLQEASTENPRVIMFSPYDAKTILSFNGSPDQRGYGSVEAIQFDENKKKYEFRRFLFPEGGTVEKVTVEKNPAICLRCHSANAAPNWEPYNKWPGAIGSNDSLSYFDIEVLQKFVMDGARHPRYSKLFRAENLKENLDDTLKFTRAFGLDVSLSDSRNEYLASRIRNSADYKKFKFAIFGALAMCPDIESFLPSSLPWARKDNIDALLAEVKTEFSHLIPQHLSLLSNRQNDAGHLWVARLRWILESRGIQLGRWGTSLQSPYLFDASLVDVRNLIWKISQLDKELTIPFDFVLHEIDNEYEFFSFYRSEYTASHRAYCEKLKAKSLTRLGQ